MSLWPARLEQLTSGGRDVRVVRSALAGPHRWLHVVLSTLMIFSTVVVVLVVFLMRTDTIRVSRVLTGSMKPLLPVGTVVVTRPVPSSQVKVGDVIMFMPPKEWAGPDAKPVIHRVAEITHTEDGATGIKTKGDNNTAVDPWTLNANGIQAYKLAWHSALLGRLFDFVKGLWLPVLIASAGFWGLYRIVRWLWFPSGRGFPEEDEAEDDLPPLVDPAPPRPPVRSWPAMMITSLFSSNGDRPYVESAPPLRVSDSDLTSAAGTVQEAVKPGPVTAPSPRQADEATTAPAAAVPLAEIPVAEEQDPNRGGVSVPSPRHPAPVPDLGYFIPAPKVTPTED